MLRDGCKIYFGNIALNYWRFREVLLVKRLQVSAKFAGKHAFTPQSFQGDMKSSETGE